jgi:RND family efflux transporter MFP subunit
MKRLKKILLNKWLWVLVLLVFAIAGFAYYRQQEANKPTYTTINPEYRTLAQTVEVSGVIDAKEKATLSFPTAAKLTWIGVKEGEYVKKWQGLASVDTRTLEKQLQQDFNTFEKTWRTHDQTLDDVDFYSPSGLTDEFKRIAEKSSFDLQNSAINVEIRDLAIKLSTLTSPIDGLIVQMSQPFSGANVSPADTIQIVNPTTIEFAAVVDEEDISLVQSNQAVELTVDAYPDETIQGLVDTIDFIPSPSQSGGTGFGVAIAFPNDNLNLKYRLGMNGTATIIITQTDNALSIPIDSLIVRDGNNFVEVLVNEEVVRTLVTVGVESEDYIQILSGITESDLVVLPNDSEED